jgi:hypothetical protein
MFDVVSRRAVLCGAVGIAAGTVASSVALAQAKPAAAPAGFVKLEETDANAKALGYMHDAKKVDAKKNPNYKPGQLCSNCLQLQGKAGEAWRPCSLFPKKLVNANGWCKVWVKKPGT